MPSEFAVESTSAGQMFLGAMLPGLVLVGIYILYVLCVGLLRPKAAPAIPFTEKLDLKLAGRVLLILIPPLTLILAVLGSIIAGIATVNQAGAIGAVGATIMAGYRLQEGERGAFLPAALAIISLVAIFVISDNYDLNIRNVQTSEQSFGITIAAIAVGAFVVSVLWSLWRTFRIDETLEGVMIDTAKTTSLVFIILLGAAMLTSAFRAFGGEELVKDFLTSLPGGFWTQFVIVMLVIFLLGFFLDFIEIAVVVVPIVAPILLMDPGANITAVWLGVMIGLNIQTSFLTPPFGFALFYLRGVAPKEVKTLDIYKGVIPFITLQLLALVIVGNTPWLVNYLPNRISLTSETAPPPVNPKLQYCIEEYVHGQFTENGEPIRNAIAEARGLQLDLLPEDIAKDLTGAFETAEDVFAKMEAVKAAEAAVADAAGEYRPMHTLVRGLERDARKLDAIIKEDQTILGRLRNTAPDSPRIARLEAAIAEETAERDALLAQIPEEWEAKLATFAELTKAELNARRQYRRAADDAYQPVAEITALLGSTEVLSALEGDLNALRTAAETETPEALVEQIEALRSAMREAGAGKATIKGLSDARKALRKDPDREAGIAGLDASIAGLADDLSWRRGAADTLLPGLQSYTDAVGDTIGLRQQPRLPREQAIFVAGCNSDHRDVSLSF
jgi:TRAP-type mannitol/chloroaromatic compound transport system permease large subunit